MEHTTIDTTRYLEFLVELINMPRLVQYEILRTLGVGKDQNRWEKGWSH